MAQGGAQLMSH
jgi:hypothetical protein